MSRRFAKQTDLPQRDYSRPAQSIDEIADHYGRCWRPIAEWEREQFQNMPSLKHAIRAAVLSQTTLNGKIHSHQQRLGYNRLEAAAPKFENNANIIAKSKNFEEIYSIFLQISRGLPGIGELAAYDFATRIGMYMKMYPQKIYLHAGTRHGANALNLTGPTCTIDQLPKPLQVLTPDEAEDCLCIYAALLTRLAGHRHPTTK